MKIYRTAMQEETPINGGRTIELHTVLDDEGNEPPATARLVDVDEAKSFLLAGFLVWKETIGEGERAAHVVRTERLLELLNEAFPEGE